jgi:hypothetical protein
VNNIYAWLLCAWFLSNYKRIMKTTVYIYHISLFFVIVLCQGVNHIHFENMWLCVQCFDKF